MNASQRRTAVRRARRLVGTTVRMRARRGQDMQVDVEALNIVGGTPMLILSRAYDYGRQRDRIRVSLHVMRLMR